MPNYRKNNKNNKNKNRNKNNNNHNSNNNNSNNNNNNNQNKNKNQPKNPEAIKHAETAAIDEELQQSGSQPNSTSSQLKHATECDVLSDFKKSFDSTSTIITSTNLTTPSTSTAIEVALVALSSAPPSTAVNNSTLSNEEIALPIVVAGTVSRDTATESDSRSPSDCSTSSSASTIVEDIRSSCLSPKMGTVNTKDLSDDLTCAVQNTLGATTSIVQEPQGKVIIHKIVREEYRVESPTTTEVPANASSVGAGVTRSRKKKCKSLDADDEDEGLVIQEMSDTSSVGDTDNPPLVSEAESETDIAAVEEFAVSCNNAQVISIQTLPIEASAAELFDGTSSQTSPTSPTSPNSFFSSSSQDDYKLRRVQKRAALETHFLPQFINPRYLDSIKEENSDISDTKSDTSDLAHLTISGYFDEQLEDDVFIDNEAVVKKADAVFPKSHLDFSKKRKHGPANAKGQTLPAAIREETIPCVVEAKIIEQESIEESCSTWSRGLTPESEDAEIVYINSTSSSVSDLMDLDYSEQALAPADQRNICEDLGLNSPPTAAQKCSSPHERTADDDNYDDTTAVAKQLIAGDVVPATDAILSQTTSCCTTKITNEQIGEEFAFEKTAETASISTLENTRDKATGIATVTPASLTASITSAALTSDSGNSCTSRTGDDRSKAEAADREQSVKTQMDNSRDILAFSIESAMTVVPSMSAIDLKVFSSPLLPPRSTPPAPTTSVKGAIDNQSLSPFSVDSSIALPDFRIGDPISPHNFTSATITTNHSNQNIDVDTTTNNSTNIINTSLSPPSPVILSTFLDRQESADSHCSDHSQSTTHSQCTAINKDSLTYCDWTDFDVDSSVSGGAATGDSSTLESSEAGSAVDSGESSAAIKKLRFLCTEKLASMPYGETVLEELANVATNIGEIGAAHKLHTTAATVAQQSSRDMPYPLPEIPHINDIQVSLGAEHLATLKHRPQSLTLTQVVQTNPKASPPQPVPEPPAKYDSWLGVPTASDPKLLVCLSPSQRSFMEVDQKGATTANADSLLDAHKKFIERRGYHEFTNAQVNAMNREASAERQIIQTAAMMKKLRKSLTPPPLPPPPPREALLTHSQQNDASHVVMETLNDQQQQQQQQQQNNHRLLAIIRDDSTDSSGLKPQQPTSSAYENISRPSIEIKNSEQQQQQMPTPQSQLQTDNNQVNSHKSVKFEKVENFANSGVSKQTERNVKVLDSSLFSSLVQTQQNKKSQQHYSGSTQSDPQDNICQLAAKTMESANSDFVGKCFPSKGVSNDNTFDLSQKRFSNLESASPFCSQILNTQPKRYSNIETSTYESRKCIENGHVVYDVTDSSRQTITDGDKGPQVFDVPVKDLSGKVHQQQPQSDTVKNCTTNGKTIMSEYKLNTKTLGAAAPATSKTTPTVATVNESTLHNKTSNSSTSTTTTTTSTEKQSKVSSEIFINRKPSESAADSDGHNAKAPEVGSSNGSECKSAFHFDHEKLFKDFDDLSLQLNMELETGSKAKQQWEKSSSNYDLSRWSTESKAKFEELKRSRHEHMQELEQEIERSRQSRQIKIPVQVEDLCGNSLVKERKLKTFQIPIRLEDTAMPAAPASAPIISTTRTYEIPIKVEPGYKVVSPQEEDSRFRRAESMFNLSERGSARSHNYSQSNAVADDWTRYAGDLGNSENISRPFQREVEICYSGRRPNIRAPRISVSTNDLSSPSYDAHGAYDVRRTTQIQTDSAPRNRQSQYLSCHSMIEQNPNATYISTTSRRSPVPPPVPQQPVEHNRQRRASLPRELHEKQLKYITNKEQELQAEFRRLEDERRRLIENIDLPVPPTVQRTSRDTYHSTQKLPTLSEDEVFRQQMAEEWLSKVAEREERRLQKIIKISKINQESSSTGGTKSTNVRCPKTDIGDEFLKRVKERRTKLAMPSDSDWESGAESQPVGRNDENRSEAEECPPVKVIEGQSETDIRQLPKHLREFAKITTTKQATDNQQHEMQHEEECHHHVETSANSASRTINKSSIVKNFKVTKTGPGHPDPVNASKVEGVDFRPQQQHKRSSLKLPSDTILRNKKAGQVEVAGTYDSGLTAAAAEAATFGNDGRYHHQHNHHHYHHQHQQHQQQHGTSTATASSAGGYVVPKRRKQTRFLLTPNRRSWSESDLLKEIDNELNLAKGFLYANESTCQSPVMIAPKFKAKAPTGTGIWTPKNQTPTSSRTNLNEISPSEENTECHSDQKHHHHHYHQTTTPTPPTPPPPPSVPIWTPQPSPTTERKQFFRPVRFESPTLPRRYVRQESAPIESAAQPPWSYTAPRPQQPPTPPATSTSCSNLNSPSETTISDVNASSSIAEKIKSFERSASASELHRPIVRRNQNAGPAILRPNEVIYNVKHEYLSEPESEYDLPKKMTQLGRRQYDGIGPTTNDGMPIILRSEVKEPHQHEWYKRLYQTIHKQKHGDDYVIRYKCPRGRYPYKSNGYVSEPEPNYDSDYSTVKYRTVDRRHLQSTTSATNTSVRGGRETQDDAIYGTMPNPIKSGQDSYRNQPGRIEDYVTGHSSISEKEKKEWWDEVMDIFNGQLDQAKLSPHYTEGNLSRALLKDQGYTSDSNVVYRKKDAPQRNPLSPVEQKQVYRSVQAGGEPPLFGFRKPAPDKPKDFDVSPAVAPAPPTKGVPLDSNGYVPESPNRYFESDVNIHYKTPIRYEYKDPIPEEELAMRQAESMQKLYQEERRRKYLQELQDMNSRRHTDNFTPTQKSPIPLNRYDDFPTDFAPKSPSVATYPKTIARALYNFQGQTARELTFKKGDVIYIRRQVDKNWYEGEHNAMIGLLPSNYVELITKDGVRQTARKPSEGQARAKFNFQAQSGIELSLNKGELVTLTRRVDDNWFEGKIANRKGIFPISYVEVLTDIGADNYATTKSIIKTSHSTFSNVRPSLETLRTNINNELNSLTQNGHHPPNGILRETKSAHKTEALHVDTNTEPVAYRALYKYRPQNSDELELHEGDIVLVLEKCDDGWFVGTSQRSGCFGTFPGNYVERL